MLICATISRFSCHISAQGIRSGCWALLTERCPHTGEVALAVLALARSHAQAARAVAAANWHSLPETVAM